MKYKGIRVHNYSSEMNRLILANGIEIKVPGLTTIKDIRKKLFSKIKSGKYCKLEFNYNNGWDTKIYQGYFKSYKEIIKIKNDLQKKHNLATLKISLSYKG